MSQGFIANELKMRLLEHAPNAILSSKKLELVSFAVEEINWAQYKKSEFDCVIAPLIHIEQESATVLFKEIRRILTSSGVFLFSALEKEESYALEKLGDALSKSGFQFPVVDREILQLQYDDMDMLRQDLEESSLNRKFVRVTKKASDDIIASFNIIYGYALGASNQKTIFGKIEIPVETVKIRKLL